MLGRRRSGHQPLPHLRGTLGEVGIEAEQPEQANPSADHQHGRHDHSTGSLQRPPPPRPPPVRSGRRQQHGGLFGGQAARQLRDGQVADQRDGRAEQHQCPQAIGIQAAQCEDRQHPQPALGTGELADQGTEEGSGHTGLQSGHQIGQRRPCPDGDQRRPASPAVAGGEIQPRPRHRAQPHEQRNQRQVVDRQRGQGDLRAVPEPEDQPQQRPERNQRETVDDQRQPQHQPLQPRQQHHQQRQRDRSQIADQIAEKGLTSGEP
ncbi:hypothetical protein SDC9_124773 [bioreactor metagenome]|uniref:Uncharacterized protein n=1 Tax=bioreactor metagenome TaxID=1076179 RepID=A0A645CLL2_9ZZZZ